MPQFVYTFEKGISTRAKAILSHSQESTVCCAVLSVIGESGKKGLFTSRFELETSCVLDRCDDQLHHVNRYIYVVVRFTIYITTIVLEHVIGSSTSFRGDNILSK